MNKGKIQQAGRFNPAWVVPTLPYLLFISLPILSLILHSSPYQIIHNLNEKQVVQAIQLSLSTSLAATLLTLLLGTPVALLLTKKGFHGRQLMDSLIDLPTVLPPSVAGVALLMTFGRKGLLGGFLANLGISLPFTFWAVVLAQLFIASPFYVRAAALGFASIQPSYVQAARVEGANPWQVFIHITLPLSAKALLSGCLMTWARALGEFGATMIFAGNYPGRTQTMPLAIYIGFEVNMDTAITLSIILISFSFLTLLIVKGFLQQQIL